MAQNEAYPVFTRSERIADAVMHIVGLAFAITGTILLIIWASGNTDAGTIAGLSVYGGTLIASFVASLFYHFTPWERARPAFRRIDHAAIYLKIAGTYTPLVVLIGSAFAYGVLVVVWALAAVGVVGKLFFFGRPGRLGVVMYLTLGWLSLLLASSLWPLLPIAGLVLIGVGGLVYTIGAVIFSLDALRYQNAIWHGFVLTASVCFFAAIATGVVAA
ncbi:MAG: hemolysin III family protein [Pseudomonadota bacterium]